jgi:hypothetical protein
MWGYAVFLFMLWFAGQSNPEAKAAYNAMVAAGAPCVVYYSRGEQPTSPPPCWYDPSNTAYTVVTLPPQ